ncbi:Hypothetical predicted protein, partial [Paramuricea clavata]
LKHSNGDFLSTGEVEGVKILKMTWISNRLCKNIVQRMGPNKTLSSISKVCKATNGIKQVVEQFDGTVGIHKVSAQHTTQDSMVDEKEMVADLVKFDPFHKVPGRSHTSFPAII